MLQDLGDYDGTLDLASKALAIFEKILPEGHPNIDIVKGHYESIKQQSKDRGINIR